MKAPVIVWGIGEIGSVFARGALKLGHSVFPVTRDTQVQDLSDLVPSPAAVIVAVGESDLDSALEQLPSVWRERLVLIQNELLPQDWQKHNLERITVASIWFEKKAGQDSLVVVPTIAHGPLSSFIQDILGTLSLPVDTVSSESELLFQLVRKNLYILTTNIAGLSAGGTVQSLWQKHQPLAREVAHDILKIQQAMTNTHFDEDELINAMLSAFEGDPNHKCMGRSAPARLQRALESAATYGVDVPSLQRISNAL